MEIRRDTLGTTVRLALVLSTIAALVTIVVDTIGDVSALPLAATVAAVGFTASWVQSGRTARTAPAMRRHRVAVVPLRHPVG